MWGETVLTTGLKRRTGDGGPGCGEWWLSQVGEEAMAALLRTALNKIQTSQLIYVKVGSIGRPNTEKFTKKSYTQEAKS